MHKRFLLLLFTILICLGLTACSREPVYYTEEEIMQYVQDCYGKNYRMTDSVRHEMTYGEQIREYIFTDEDGFSFSVSTGSEKHTVWGGLLTQWTPTLMDSYIESRIAFCEEDINKLFEESEIRAELTSEGDNRTVPGTTYMLSLYLNKSDQMKEASQMIAKLDRIVKFVCDRTGAKIGTQKNDTKKVHIYLRPDKYLAGDTRKNWRKSANLYLYEISSIALTTATRQRLNDEDVLEQMRHDYSDTAKWTHQEIYTLTGKMASRYPAPCLEVSRIGTHDMTASHEKFYLFYDRGTEIYWMTDLDLCQDYDGFPYEYEGRGKFAALVDYLGGLYSCDGLKAQWRMNGMTWDAKLDLEKTDLSPYTFSSVNISCNGMWQKLSTPPSGTDNGTPSGRWYSIEDLIRMLDIEVTISQENQTAIFSSRGILDQK